MARIIKAAGLGLGKAPALDQKIRAFEAEWRQKSLEGNWDCPGFRKAFGGMESTLRQLDEIATVPVDLRQLRDCLQRRLRDLPEDKLNPTTARWRNKTLDQDKNVHEQMIRFEILKERQARSRTWFNDLFVDPCNKF